MLQLILIRLGDSAYESEEADILEFLAMLFYPHKRGFRKKISKYIDVESALAW